MIAEDKRTQMLLLHQSSCEDNWILTQAQGELRLWFMLPLQGRLLLCKC